MAWVVDTCLLIDIAEGDPVFGKDSVRLLDSRRSDGLVICPVTYVELAPVFSGDLAGQELFLSGVGVTSHTDWIEADTLAAHAAWWNHVAAKRAGHARKRPIADVLIGAFSS